METSISIIDKPRSKVSDEANVRLLWTAMLMGETVNSSSEPAGVIDLLLDYDTLSERDRLDVYLMFQRDNPAGKKEDLDVIEDYYSKIVRGRHMKGKTKEHIVLLMKGEKMLKDLFNDFKAYLTNVCTNLKVSQLIPLSCNEQDNWNKPLLAWTFPSDSSEQRIMERIKVISQTVTDSNWFPFFDSGFKNTFTSADITSIKNSGYVNFISDFLFEMPEPFSLTTSQINLVRNDFSQSSWKLWHEMEKMNGELKEIPFGQINMEKILLLFQERISPLKSLVQKTSDKNSCFSELKKEKPDAKVYRINAGVSSYTSLIDFYKELGIISVSDTLYIREDMATRVDINNSRMFLFLEAVENADGL